MQGMSYSSKFSKDGIVSIVCQVSSLEGVNTSPTNSQNREFGKNVTHTHAVRYHDNRCALHSTYRLAEAN